MAAIVGTKTEFQSKEDLLKLSTLLDNSLKAYASGGSISADKNAAVEATISGALKEMEQFLAVSEEDGPAGLGTPSNLGLKSPMLPPLSPLPKDAEVETLETQVEEASRRVAELRVAMQSQLQEKLAEKLAACRPRAEISPPRGEIEAEAAADAPMSPAAEELQSRLGQAAGKIPELVARLTDAQARLDRVMDAAAGTAGAPEKPPNTVQRAVLGAEDAEDEEEDGSDDPAIQQALQSGLVSSRHSKDLAPVPFPEVEGGGAALLEDMEGAGAEGEAQ